MDDGARMMIVPIIFVCGSGPFMLLIYPSIIHDNERLELQVSFRQHGIMGRGSSSMGKGMGVDPGGGGWGDISPPIFQVGGMACTIIPPNNSP